MAASESHFCMWFLKKISFLWCSSSFKQKKVHCAIKGGQQPNAIPGLWWAKPLQNSDGWDQDSLKDQGIPRAAPWNICTVHAGARVRPSVKSWMPKSIGWWGSCCSPSCSVSWCLIHLGGRQHVTTEKPLPVQSILPWIRCVTPARYLTSSVLNGLD